MSVYYISLFKTLLRDFSELLPLISLATFAASVVVDPPRDVEVACSVTKAWHGQLIIVAMVKPISATVAAP